MPGPHCPTCESYEERVMARQGDEVLPPDVKPCESFAMSDRFREWAVAGMRKEVMAQVKTAGLDRMAILKKREGKGVRQSPRDPPADASGGR